MLDIRLLGYTFHYYFHKNNDNMKAYRSKSCAAIMSNNPIRPFKDQFPTLSKGVYIDPSSVVIGDVEMGEECSVWPLVVIRGDVNHIRIGYKCNIQDGSVIHVSRPSPTNPEGYPTILGDCVTVGHKALIHGCTIGNNVLIGMGAIVMDGVIIEDHVIVGAGTTVTPGKRLEEGHLYMGSPAVKKRKLSSDEIKHLEDSANAYAALKSAYWYLIPC